MREAEWCGTVRKWWWLTSVLCAVCALRPLRPDPPFFTHPASDQPRKRRSRWADADVKTTLPGLPTMVSGKVSQTELDNYAIHVRLEEIARKLRDGDIVPPERMRWVCLGVWRANQGLD